MHEPLERMPAVMAAHMEAQARGERRGEVSVFTCPECGGSLWQVDEKELIRFRCHVGHVYNGEALIAEQTEALEAALWTAVRTFREKSVLARQLAEQERRRGAADVAARFEERAEQAERYGRLILQHVLNGSPAAVGEPDVPMGQASTP